MNENKTLITVLIVALIAGVGLTGFIYFKNRSNLVNETNDKDKVNQIKTLSPTLAVITPGEKAVAIGTEKVAKGEYQKFEDNLIYYKTNGVIKFKKAKSDQIVIACTNQNDLESSEKLDYAKIKKLDPVSPTDFSVKMSVGTNMVLLSDQIGGELLVHTVAIKEEECK